MSYTYTPVEMKLFYPPQKGDRKIDRSPKKVRLSVEVDGVGVVVTQDNDSKIAGVWSIHAQMLQNWQEPLLEDFPFQNFRQLRNYTRMADARETLRDFMADLRDPKIYLVMNMNQDLSELMQSSLGEEYPYLIMSYQGEKETAFSFNLKKKVFRLSKNQPKYENYFTRV